MDKTERQFNLIALMLDARRPLPGSRIREALYDDATSDESFKRMFERDKEDIRALGIRLEIEAIGAWDEGYIARREDVTLPELDLTPAEHAALMLASQAWGDGTLGPASPRIAGMKLAAATGGAAAAPWILPHVDVRSPNLSVLLDAILRRKRVAFRYRGTGAAAPSDRDVEPYGLRFRSAWYLNGFDRGRGEVRLFKVDRIDGAVRIGSGKAADFEAPASGTTDWTLPTEADAEARVAFTPELAWWAERRPGVRGGVARDDGRTDVIVPVPDEDRFVRWVLGFGDDAEVIEPEHLRAETMRRLRAAAGREA